MRSNCLLFIIAAVFIPAIASAQSERCNQLLPNLDAYCPNLGKTEVIYYPADHDGKGGVTYGVMYKKSFKDPNLFKAACRWKVLQNEKPREFFLLDVDVFSNEATAKMVFEKYVFNYDVTLRSAGKLPDGMTTYNTTDQIHQGRPTRGTRSMLRKKNMIITALQVAQNSKPFPCGAKRVSQLLEAVGQ